MLKYSEKFQSGCLFSKQKGFLGSVSDPKIVDSIYVRLPGGRSDNEIGHATFTRSAREIPIIHVTLIHDPTVKEKSRRFQSF